MIDRPPEDRTAQPEDLVEAPEEVEVVDALPVVAEVRELVPAVPIVAPIVQTAAAAATGFLAGAATLALMRRASGRRLARQASDLRTALDGARRPAPTWPLEPGRSYVVHVRVLSRPPE